MKRGSRKITNRQATDAQVFRELEDLIMEYRNLLRQNDFLANPLDYEIAVSKRRTIVHILELIANNVVVNGFGYRIKEVGK